MGAGRAAPHAALAGKGITFRRRLPRPPAPGLIRFSDGVEHRLGLADLEGARRLHRHVRHDAVLGHQGEALAAQAEAAREETRRTLAADLEAALADHQMHHSQWQRARDVLLPLARKRADLEIASYSAGRASLADAIEAKTALADAELTVLDREALVAADSVRLTITFGSADR